MRLGAVAGVALEALLAGLLPLAVAHGHGGHGNSTVDLHGFMTTAIPSSPSGTSLSMNATLNPPQSYFTYPGYSGLIIAHAVLMIVAWLFILPIGIVYTLLQLLLKSMLKRI